MKLEAIIRPFQLGDVFNARSLPPVQPPTTEPKADVDKVWGKGNSGNYTAFVLSGLVGGVVTFNETSRVTRKVRVTNPTDSSQFVDVERIEKLVMATSKGDEIHFNLNN